MTASIHNSEFERVTTSDIDCIKAYLSYANYEESNHNLINLFLWDGWYPLWLCKQEHFLILMGLHEGSFFIYMPLCEARYFDEAILYAKEIFDRYQIPFVLSCYTEKETEKVLNLLPDFRAVQSRESADYIYEAAKLRTLSGKKLQKRRNHYNAFIKEYEGRYQYVAMNGENARECLAFLNQWKDDSDDLFLHYEKAGSAYILNNFELFDGKGGIMLLDGKIEAFIVGSRLSDRMIQLNIEKANTSYRGMYQALEKMFLSDNFLDCEFVNKEDDMGNPAIRAAKLAYYPCELIMKSWIEKEKKHDQTSQT